MDIDFLLQYVEFSSDELESIKKFFFKQTIRRNELFLKEGDICNSVAYVENGYLILSQVSESGSEQILYFSSPGDLISDYISFLRDRPTDTRIRALNDSSLLVINKEDIYHLYETMFNFQKLGRIIAEIYLVDFANKLKTDSLPPLLRYDQLIAQKPDIFEQVPQYMIASYLGISPEWLSKIRSKK